MARPKKAAVKAEGLPSEQLLFSDLETYCHNLLWIRNKSGKMVPFIWNEVQKKLNDRIERENRSGNRKRLILKYRRAGVSTYFQARNFFLTANNESKYAVTLAHDNPSTAKIFEISLLYYNRLPDWAQPTRATENKRELNFSKLGSMFYIGTAGGRAFGRGQTIQRAHCSEAAFYPKSVDVANFMAGLSEACSHGEIDVETTANGHGNWFHRTWVGAKNGENSYVPIFLSWKDDPELQIPTPQDFDKMRLSTEEEELVRVYSLTPQQMTWRRMKMRELYDPERGDSIFKQEYPINDVEAFISSGICFFDTDKIAFLANLCETPGSTGDYGRLKIWKEPKEYRSYAISGDIGEGVAGGARTSISVIDVDSCEQVAVWTGICSPEDAGRKMADLGRLYNSAMLAPEANNYGHSTLNTLLNEINYPYIYQHTDYQAIATVQDGEVTPKWGWQTNGKTRPLLLSELRYAVQNGLYKINDPEFFSEAMTFIDNGHGKYEASKDSYDDRIMSLGIGWQIRKRMFELAPYKSYVIDTGYRTVSESWDV